MAQTIAQLFDIDGKMFMSYSTIIDVNLQSSRLCLCKMSLLSTVVQLNTH